MSTKTIDIINILESIAPLELAEVWDNCGLQVGSKCGKVSKIYLSLDPTLENIQNAIKHNASLIITHHPLTITGFKNIDLDSYIGKIVSLCIKNNLSLFSYHTNFDSAEGCLNDFFASKIGIKDTKPLVSSKDEKAGLGRIGYLPKSIKLKTLIKKIKTDLNIKTLKVIGNLENEIKKVALNTGSGSSLVKNFLETSADLYISGDIRYHDALNIVEEKRCCIDAGHFGTEVFFVDLVYDILKTKLKEKNIKLEIVKSTIEQEPFFYI